MQPIKIIISGKKNTKRMTFFMKTKGGKRLRETPIVYYTDVYKQWAKIAIQTLAVFKTKHLEIEFPIQDQLNLRCLVYRDNFRNADGTNLLEGIQDVLSGKSGVDKDYNISSSIYQIIEDDNLRFVGSYDGTRFLIDLVNPRTEIILSEYIL